LKQKNTTSSSFLYVAHAHASYDHAPAGAVVSQGISRRELTAVIT
jgi:hypothetical protein